MHMHDWPIMILCNDDGEPVRVAEDLMVQLKLLPEGDSGN